MKPLFTMLLWSGLLLRTLCAAAGVYRISDGEAFEHEGVTLVTIYRGESSPGSFGESETIEFYTENGSAVAGRDFVFTRETITFEPGQTVAVVGVPIIDNGLLDGDRHFGLHTEPAAPFDECFPPFFCWPIPPATALIRDNEQAPTRLDLSFRPQFLQPTSEEWPFISELPDGRILISGGPRGIAVLKPDGAVDPSFYPDPVWAEVYPCQVLPNGQVLAYAWDCANCGSGTNGLIKLSPSGKTERLIRLPLPGDSATEFVAAQPDGRLLFRSWGANSSPNPVLRRVNADGSPDPSFRGPGIDTNDHLFHASYSLFPSVPSVQIQADGKILIPLTGGIEASRRGPPCSSKPNQRRQAPPGSFARVRNKLPQPLVCCAPSLHKTAVSRVFQRSNVNADEFERNSRDLADVRFHSQRMHGTL